jgi:hypothetical protein
MRLTPMRLSIAVHGGHSVRVGFQDSDVLDDPLSLGGVGFDSLEEEPLVRVASSDLWPLRLDESPVPA